MRAFEDFKSHREKIDPSTRKMSEYQWEQAYAAYCSSRERVRAGKKEKNSTVSASVRAGSHSPTLASEAATLKATIRKGSAYSDARLVVNLLAWILIALLVGLKIVEMLVLGDTTIAVLSLLTGFAHVAAVLVVKAMLQILIDIPDIALHQEARERQLNSSIDQNPKNLTDKA